MAMTEVTSGLIKDNLLHIQDQKTNGTAGGSSSTGINTRVLNTVVTNEITGASLATNQITLPIGTYYAEFSAPIYHSGTSSNNTAVLHLYNVDDTAVEVIGEVDRQEGTTGTGGTSRSYGSGRFTITAQKDFELRHDIAAARASTGLGYAYSDTYTTVEIYAEIKIWKVG